MILTHLYSNNLSSLVSRVNPTPLENTQLRLLNQTLADEINWPESLRNSTGLNKALFTKDGVLSKHAVAQKYGGHQFGQWNPMLGDGRGLLLGEVETKSGQFIDLHLKGAGPTPYSRHADGRAVLRSTLREYIASEALHHLGIPSSRSLCLLTSSEPVYREQAEPAAMMIRTAPSHIRFGHFEYFYYSKQNDKLSQLIQFTLKHHFQTCIDTPNPIATMLTQVVQRTARMVALWQAYGFVHGVMNTDNMSIHGITFDYGPYAFINGFKADAVFNHSDHHGRYAFNQQPSIALWNLNALANAFTDYCTLDELKTALGEFEPTFYGIYQSTMLERLGLTGVESKLANKLLNEWLSLIENQEIDYTLSFRRLAEADLTLAESPLRNDFIDRAAFDLWWRYYREARKSQHKQNSTTLLAKNPTIVLRTHHLQTAIDQAENGDFSLAESLLDAIKSPFDDSALTRQFSQPPPLNTQISLSCSS